MSFFISERICAWIVTSSAVVGSSAISSDGLQESAIAIITRWRMPPENSCGYWSTRRSAPRQPLVGAQLLLDLPADGVDRRQRRHRILEDHRDLAAADVAHLAARE